MHYYVVVATQQKNDRVKLSGITAASSCTVALLILIGVALAALLILMRNARKRNIHDEICYDTEIILRDRYAENPHQNGYRTVTENSIKERKAPSDNTPPECDETVVKSTADPAQIELLGTRSEEDTIRKINAHQVPVHFEHPQKLSKSEMGLQSERISVLLDNLENECIAEGSQEMSTAKELPGEQDVNNRHDTIPTCFEEKTTISTSQDYNHLKSACPKLKECEACEDHCTNRTCRGEATPTSEDFKAVTQDGQAKCTVNSQASSRHLSSTAPESYYVIEDIVPNPRQIKVSKNTAYAASKGTSRSLPAHPNQQVHIVLQQNAAYITSSTTPIDSSNTPGSTNDYAEIADYDYDYVEV